jgi:putative membrane protein insertion efficiency factor
VTPASSTVNQSSERHHEGVVDAAAPGDPRGRVVGWLIAAIHGYQLARSGRPTGCRFLPTCSEYAIEALDQHGVLRGSHLATKRLLRCTPWGGHGVDPVPDRRTT